jgi:superfamily II DNA or RNA helicase
MLSAKHASVATTQRYTAVSSAQVRAIAEAAAGKAYLQLATREPSGEQNQRHDRARVNRQRASADRRRRANQSHMNLNDLLGHLDPEPRVRGKEFEPWCKWFLRNDPVYAREFNHVWLWKEWPDKWKETEAGIDLVAETNAGELWAIQVKAYGEDQSVTMHDMSQFLAESARRDSRGEPLFTYRLLIATTEHLSFHAEDIADRSYIPVGTVRRSRLEEVDWPSSLRARAPRQPKQPVGHWAYQGAARDAVVEGFTRSDRGQLIMACGTGKTITSLFIKEASAATRTLVLVPSLSLLGQTLREWRANQSADFQVRMVCSDVTVAKEDDPATSLELGLPPTTDAEQIAEFLREPGPRVVFSTYQSSPEIATAFTLGRVPEFDLVIADEAHRCAGPVASMFATILDNGRIPARRRLFMTATPLIFTKRVQKATAEYDFVHASMDDEEKFGPVFHRLSFGEAIGKGLLTDYRVYIIGVDPKHRTFYEWAETRELVRRVDDVTEDAGRLATQIAVAKAIHDRGLHRVITFHTRVKQAKEFADTLEEVVAWMPEDERPSVKVTARHISGKDSAGERHRHLQHLQHTGNEQCRVLSNARCLTEGVDVPALDGVAFIDPKRSVIDIAQAVGRAIRRADGKTLGHIVIPVFIEQTDVDTDTALTQSAFKPVWDVVLALRAHDDDLREELDELRHQLGKRLGPRGRVKLPPKIEVDLGHHVGDDFARAFNTKLVEMTTASWEFWFGLLERYAEREGHAKVSQGHSEVGFQLGAWVTNQRVFYGKGTLEADRIRRLGELPGWTWDPHADRWEDGFGYLLRYTEREGHARPLLNHVEDGYKLGTWVVNQRGAYGKGKLQPDRIRRLGELPGWVWNTDTAQWEEGFSCLLRYVEREGHTRPPLDHVEDGYKLGHWVSRQRNNYRKGTLDADRIRRLGELPGWRWDPRTDQWEEGFTYLLRFVEREGHTRVPNGLVEEAYRLGAWVNKQRSRKGTLETDRVCRLEELPGWTWDPRAAQWEEGFSYLLRFVEREGHTRVPKNRVEAGYRLGAWVSKQRSRKDIRNADQIHRLAELPSWTWNTKADQWEEGFGYLLRYIEREGHIRVPPEHVEDGCRLGRWVIKQRNRKDTLSANRIRRLGELPGWTWDPHADRWEEGFSHLLRFVEREGHARVPAKHVEDCYKLGQWVGVQRTTYGKGTLEAERIGRLGELPGWLWDAGFLAAARRTGASDSLRP